MAATISFYLKNSLKRNKDFIATYPKQIREMKFIEKKIFILFH
jgi:hypothetical protein